jgi:hypothetical protein
VEPEAWAELGPWRERMDLAAMAELEAMLARREMAAMELLVML